MNAESSILYIREDPLNIIPLLSLLIILYSLRKEKKSYSYYLKWFVFFVLLIICLIYLTYNTYYIDMWLVIDFSFVIINLSKIKKTLKHYFFSKPQNQNNNIPVVLAEPLNGLELFIYERDFKQIFSENDFKVFISMAEIKILKKSYEMAKEGTIFDKVYYIAKVPALKSIVLRSKYIDISYIEEGSWIGIIEIILFNHNNNLDKWLVDVHLHYDNEEVILYEWDKTSLLNMMNHSTDFELVNKVFLIWINYLVFCVKRLDDHISKALRGILINDKSARIEAIPIYRYLSGAVRKNSSESKLNLREKSCKKLVQENESL